MPPDANPQSLTAFYLLHCGKAIRPILKLTSGNSTDANPATAFSGALARPARFVSKKLVTNGHSTGTINVTV